MIQLTCLIPSDLHIDAKMLAVSQGVPLRKLVEESLAMYVADNPLETTNSIRRRTRERS